MKACGRLARCRNFSPGVRACDDNRGGASVRGVLRQSGVLGFRAKPDWWLSANHPSGGRGNDAGFAAADLRPLFRQTPLRTLRVDGLGFGDELMTEVSAARQLEFLGVSSLPITDAGLERLRQLRHLQMLDIERTQISFDAAEASPGLPSTMPDHGQCVRMSDD